VPTLTSGLAHEAAAASSGNAVAGEKFGTDSKYSYHQWKISSANITRTNISFLTADGTEGAPLPLRLLMTWNAGRRLFW